MKTSNFTLVPGGVLKKKPLTFTYAPLNFTLIKNNFNIFPMSDFAPELI